jgi:regulatory protein
MAVLHFWRTEQHMAGTITALKAQKRNRERVSVFLDGRFAFGVPAIVAARLKRGQVLSDTDIEYLQEEGAVESGYGKALDFLSYRPRSRAEVADYLRKRGLVSRAIESICSRLEQAGLVDDEEFARFWVGNRERFRPKGLRALRHELRLKGISETVIEGAVAGIDVSDSAYRAAEKKARQLRHLDRQTFDRKLSAYLARRGFDYHVAREVMDRHWTELAVDE